MTSPGVFLTVLDGSPLRWAATRVVLVVAMTWVAWRVGLLIGFCGFLVITVVLLAPVVVGHLLTFGPLSALGATPRTSLLASHGRKSAGHP